MLFMGFFSAQGKTLGLQYATHFHIEYLDNGCKIVTDGMGRRFCLAPRGKHPASRDTDQMPVIQVPLHRVATRWSTIPGFLSVLNVLDTVKGVTRRKEEWCARKIKRQMDQGAVADLGNPGSMDYEKLYALALDLFFTSPWVQTPRMMTLGIPVVAVTEYLEPHPLGRMEWIKFFAAFYNREKVAAQYFNRAVAQVRQIVKKVNTVQQRPRVLWGLVRESGTVFAPGKSTYVNKMIAMAGGISVFDRFQVGREMPVSRELFYHQGRDADIYLYPGTLLNRGIRSVGQLAAFVPMLRDFKAVQTDRVWCFQPWYWESVHETDRIIADLAAIFHPDLFSGHAHHCFVKVPRK